MRYIKPVRNTRIPYLYDFLFNERNNIRLINIGSCNVSVTHDKAVINTMEIFQPYQRKGYGSFFLRETENYLRNSLKVREVSLLAWQPTSGFNVLDFYMRNGYKHVLGSATQTYDDAVTLYDLHHLFKML